MTLLNLLSYYAGPASPCLVQGNGLLNQVLGSKKKRLCWSLCPSLRTWKDRIEGDAVCTTAWALTTFLHQLHRALCDLDGDLTLDSWTREWYSSRSRIFLSLGPTPYSIWLRWTAASPPGLSVFHHLTPPFPFLLRPVVLSSFPCTSTTHQRPMLIRLREAVLPRPNALAPCREWVLLSPRSMLHKAPVD